MELIRARSVEMASMRDKSMAAEEDRGPFSVEVAGCAPTDLVGNPLLLKTWAFAKECSHTACVSWYCLNTFALLCAST